MSGFVIEPLSAGHERKTFSCGSEPLDRYLREQARQDIKRRIALCYVATLPDEGQIAGFYTLSASDIPLQDLPDDQVRKLPRYPSVPIARIGRLAIDHRFQGRRLGAALLWDAAARVMRSEMAVYAIAVDAKDDKAAAFYRHLGFVALATRPLTLFLPLATFTATNG